MCTAPLRHNRRSRAAAHAQLLTRPSGPIGGAVFLEQGPEAWDAFQPLVAPSDAGGECSSLGVVPAEFPNYIVHYPSRAHARTVMNLWVEADGKMSRSSESRMSEPVEPLSGSLEPSIRDSILQARQQRIDRTMISLDFAADRGSAVNHRLGLPAGAVMADVASVDTMQLLALPGDRARRAFGLCTRR